MEQYVKLKHVQQLINLYEERSKVYDWSDAYGQYSKKIENTVAWLERNAKSFERGDEVHAEDLRYGPSGIGAGD